MQTNDPNSFLENIGEAIGYIEAYADRKIQLAKLEAVEKSAKTTASLVTGFILFSFIPIIFCVFSLGLGFLLTDLFGWTYACSFFALAGFYTLLGLLIFWGRKKLFTDPILGMIIREFFKK